MLEVYLEMIPKLNHEAFSHISGTPDFDLHHQVSNTPVQLKIIVNQRVVLVRGCILDPVTHKWVDYDYVL